MADVMKRLAAERKRREQGEAIRDEALAAIARLAAQARANGHSKKAIYTTAGISRPSLDDMLKRRRAGK